MRFKYSGTSVIAVAAVLTIAALASPATARADCQFEILAHNDMRSRDAYVYLYDATVTNFGTLIPAEKQLKIQNQRVATGKKMNRRYTAPGRCAAKRQWKIPATWGTSKHCFHIWTEGTSSTSRTVDLGPVSQWPAGIDKPCTEHR